ncbi:MAG: acyltransferase family protein [Clostridia bacterium]|nr:acyltransferase family protein [Clostridia bacterium]
MAEINEKKLNDNVSKKLTVYGFVMTIFIVLSHWTHFYRGMNLGTESAVLDVLDNFYSMLGLLSLASFFLLSGFLFYYGIESYKDLGGKLVRRLISLGIPFAVWNAVYLIYNILYSLYKSEPLPSFKEILLGFSIMPFDAPLWYLLALLVLAALSPIILLLKKHRAIGIAVLAVVFVGCLIFTSRVSLGGYGFWITRLVGYIPLYMLGAVLGMYCGGAVAHEKYHTGTLGIVAAVIFVAGVVYFTFFPQKISPLNTVFYYAMAVTSWLAVPSGAFERFRVRFPVTVSYFVYSMHALLILILNWLVTRKLLVSVDLPIAVDIIIHLALVGVLYLICLGVAYLAKRILPERVYRIFAGGSAGRKLI